MILSDLSIARPVGAIMITLALVVFGLISYSRLGVEDMPNIDLPYLTIQTIYPGADPATVESEVTKKIEDEVATVSGIKNLTSISAENVSLVFIEFQLEVDVDIAAQDVRDRMSRLQMSLPDNAESPIVEKFDFSSTPIIDIAVGGDVRPQDLADYVKDNLKPRIESIDGVGRVNITGLREREIKVWLDQDKMSSYGISVQQIIGVIQAGNVEIPGGRVETGTREYLVITAGDLNTVEQFSDLVVKQVNGQFIKLSDVATIKDELQDERSITRLNGESAIGLGVVNKPGTNDIAVSDAVHAVIDEIKTDIPPSIQISIPSDNSLFVRDSYEQVQEHLFLGGTLAIIIVLLFLGSFRTTLIAAIAIPTSIITTYIFMNFLGFSLNNVTMMAFTLMVGMLIDDAIVVLENIFRHLEMGKNPMSAAKEGAKEIALPVLATTLSIVAVFVPVAFMSGIIGRFMYQYGITVAVGTMVSYFVAITVSPMLASLYMKTHSGIDNFIIFTVFNAGFKKFENGYRGLIGAALRHKGLTILIAFIALIASLYLFWLTPKEFFTPSDDSQVNITIEMPLGTPIHGLSEFTKQIEDIASQIPEVRIIYTTLGGGTFGEQNQGNVFLALSDKAERERTKWEVEDELRAKFAVIPGAKIVLGSPQHFGSSYAYTFNLTGNDMAQLQQVTNQFVDAMRQDPIFREVDTSLREGSPEVRINIDRVKASDLGIDIATIGSTLRMLVSGEDTISTFKQGGNQYDLKIRLSEQFRNRPEDLLSLVVYNRDGDSVEVSSFADIQISSGTAQIEHLNKMRSIAINTNLNPGYTTGDASTKVEQMFATMLPIGIQGKIGGEAQIMAESFQSMGFSLILGIILIYVVLATQFNHFVHPLTIMISLPLSFVGAFAFLFFTGMALSMFAMIGIIMLMGLVTKNAILVVEFANQLRERGLERDEAMMTAGPIRLRPVLMTTFSTIFGMLPAALMLGGGSGVETRAPMAVAVIGGLTASTLLTLVVVPVVYSLFDQATEWVLKKFRIKKEDSVEAEYHDQV